MHLERRHTDRHPTTHCIKPDNSSRDASFHWTRTNKECIQFSVHHCCFVVFQTKNVCKKQPRIENPLFCTFNYFRRMLFIVRTTAADRILSAEIVHEFVMTHSPVLGSEGSLHAVSKFSESWQRHICTDPNLCRFRLVRSYRWTGPCVRVNEICQLFLVTLKTLEIVFSTNTTKNKSGTFTISRWFHSGSEPVQPTSLLLRRFLEGFNEITQFPRSARAQCITVCWESHLHT